MLTGDGPCLLMVVDRAAVCEGCEAALLYFVMVDRPCGDATVVADSVELVAQGPVGRSDFGR